MRSRGGLAPPATHVPHPPAHSGRAAHSAARAAAWREQRGPLPPLPIAADFSAAVALKGRAAQIATELAALHQKMAGLLLDIAGIFVIVGVVWGMAALV